ncbi:MAG: hypothetical protein IJM73_05495 [Spirochaetales bacterium]|nr:hypothetical protein [Spirochaetales bacterium]
MKYNERVQKWSESMRTTRQDADEGDGHWVTTKEGNHMFINGEGEPTKGNPHVLAVAKGEGKSSTEKTGKASNTKKSQEITAESRMTGKTITIGSLQDRAKKGMSTKEKNDLMQDAMDLAVENPLSYFDVKSALVRAGLDEQFEWEMGPANFNGFEELIKPAFDKKKAELKKQIPPPSKNKSTSGVFNGKKVVFANVRNAEYPAHSRQQRFIDIRVEDPETGEKIGSYAENDYESAMEHVYRIAGLRTK